MTDQGARFVEALAAKDSATLLTLFADDVDFRGMTPGRFWEASTPAAALDILYHWFEESDVIVQVESVATDVVVDRHRVDYRLAVRNADGLHTVEQRAYFDVDENGRIVTFNAMCSGYRAVEPAG